MSRARGYILVLLVAIWATMPALAGLCPEQVPPCCRGMRRMCRTSSSNAPALKVCCQIEMPGAAASPAAVVTSTDRAWHEVPPAMVAETSVPALPSSVRGTVATAPSPPILLPSRTSSVLRI